MEKTSAVPQTAPDQTRDERAGDGGTASFEGRLRELLCSDRAADDVVEYFAEPDDGPGFVGRHFDRLGLGRGTTGPDPDVVTPVDLVAVQTLSISVPAPVAVQLLEGSLGAEVTALLRQVPVDVVLGTPAAAAHLADGAPADRVWWLLKAQPGMGSTTVGKVLARKRPGLLPVYDDVVACAVGRPAGFWLALQDALASPTAHLADRLDELARLAPEPVSRLRVFDVVVWMAHRVDHREHCSRGR